MVSFFTLSTLKTKVADPGEVDPDPIFKKIPDPAVKNPDTASSIENQPGSGTGSDIISTTSFLLRYKSIYYRDRFRQGRVEPDFDPQQKIGSVSGSGLRKTPGSAKSTAKYNQC